LNWKTFIYLSVVRNPTPFSTDVLCHLVNTLKLRIIEPYYTAQKQKQQQQKKTKKTTTKNIRTIAGEKY
jgi:hypothetical protein